MKMLNEDDIKDINGKNQLLETEAWSIYCRPNHRYVCPKIRFRKSRKTILMLTFIINAYITFRIREASVTKRVKVLYCNNYGKL